MTGCAGLDRATMPGDDSDLETSILDRLHNDEVVAGEGVIVRVNDGVVTLIGGIEDPGIRARAEAIVRAAPGVTQVISRLGP